DLADVLGPSFAPRPPAREGLPPGFRMRAEGHYIDDLVPPRVTETSGPGLAPPPHELTEARPSVVDASALNTNSVAAYPAASAIDRAILQAVTQEVLAIQSASRLLGGGGTIAERVATDLVKAQSWRAAWLLRAAALLAADTPVRRTPPGRGKG